MNPLWQSILILLRLRKSQPKNKSSSPSPGAAIGEGETYLRQMVYLILGIASAAFGLESFLIPGALLDGGATGISLLLNLVSGYPVSVLLILVNAPFVALGWIQMGKNFGIKSSLAILLLALVIATIHFPVATQDRLLIPVFGGFFLGLGIGLVVRAGAVIDGSEVLAIFLSKKTGFSIGEIIFLFNVLIFSIAAYLLSLETALYSLLTYFVASKTIDYVLDGFEEYIGVTIVSDYSPIIRSMILTKLHRGVTVYDGHKGYKMEYREDSQIEILFTVITRLELARLQRELKLIDPNAFVVMHKIKDTKGGMIRHRFLKATH
ncbi:MAG: YitT family protein [Bacteroidota bacterium]